MPHKRYVEPFVGGASLFLHANPTTALLGDVNHDLIECYAAVSQQPWDVWTILSAHMAEHDALRYAEVRGCAPSTPAARAARFIYLNRSCFNGLYRVNKSGNFNVPLGTPRFAGLSLDSLLEFAGRLRSAELIASDFEFAVDSTDTGDLLVLDPPYTVKHNNNGFVRYNEQVFRWADQQRLAFLATKAAQRGVHIVGMNAAHTSVLELYDQEIFDIRTVSRSSTMAGNNRHRGQYNELLITSKTLGKES